MTLLTTTQQHMVMANRATSRSAAARCAAGELTRIIRNAYVETAFLVGAPDKWEAARRVTAARICAVAASHGPASVISHESAAVAHGIGMVSDLVDIHVCTASVNGRRTATLPAVGIPGMGTVPAARVVRHRLRLDPLWTCEPTPGVRITDVRTTAVQCAQALSAREALVVVCGALRVLSRFSRFVDQVAASRAREARARADLAVRLSEIPTRRGSLRARAVIDAADAACEEVPERILLWILCSAGFRDVRTQVHHRVGSRDYYVDVELPWCHLLIESDGDAKHGATVTDVHGSYDAQMRRQKDLEAQGNSFVRFRRRELDAPASVVAEVARRAGLARPPRPVRLLAQ